jgi:uncharacterized protein (DUF427 family)
MPNVMKTPGPDHPISIEPAGGRVTVRAGNVVLARSDAALCLREAGHAPVLYIPRADVAMDKLARTELATYCPYKGDCAYYRVAPAAAADAGAAGEQVDAEVAWTYEAPYPAVAAIREYLAFYPDRVDAIDLA